MIKWDKPCYKCLSHFCDLSCKEPKHLQAPQPKEPEQREPTKQEHNILMGALKRSGKVVAQPEQEPVAYCWKSLSTGDLFDFVENKNGDALKEQDEDFPSSNLVLLYTTPPQRKPLTDEEILTVARDHYNPHQRPEISFARAIEAAHGIKE